MKVTTNTALIENRAKWGRRIAPVTMVFLVGGLITNFLSINQPEYFRVTLILLLIGFVSAIISSHLVNNWVREPRADQILSQLLKKFGNDYLLFNYTAPVSHVLLAPNGIHVITVKRNDGQITVKGDRISRKFDWRRLIKFFGNEGLGSPIVEAEAGAQKLSKFLEKSVSDGEIPPIKSLVLFTNQDAELQIIEEPSVPVMHTSEFKSYVRDEGKQRNISTDQRKKLAEVLANA